MSEVTTDDFLGGLVKLKQYKYGYRATSDAVLAASAVCAKPNETLLDVGCGNGIVGLCVAARVPNVHVVGVEIQPELVELTRQNADLNHKQMTVVAGDITKKLPELHGVQFHHVVTNPPFYTEQPQRQYAQLVTAYKQTLSIKTWVDFCLCHLRAKGSFTMIHRAESVPEILSVLNGRLGALRLVPIWPKSGVAPKRVLIQGIMNSKKSFELHPGFVMHHADDTRTESAEQIMRFGKSLWEL